jgi:hypothetical protein
MNRDRAVSLVEKIKAQLEELGKQEGLKFDVNSVSFSSTSLSLKITSNETNTDNKALDLQNTILSKRFGFTQNIIGLEFTCSNGDFIIEGFKTQNRKYPIIARRKSDGTSYKFHPSNVLKYLGGNKLVNRAKNLDNLLDS